MGFVVINQDLGCFGRIHGKPPWANGLTIWAVTGQKSSMDKNTIHGTLIASALKQTIGMDLDTATRIMRTEL
jgi:hypothetical protein